MTQGWSSGMLAAWQARQVTHLYFARRRVRPEVSTGSVGFASRTQFLTIWSSRAAKWPALPEVAGLIISAGFRNNSSGAYQYQRYLNQGSSRGAATSASNDQWRRFEADILTGPGSSGSGMGDHLYHLVTSSGGNWNTYDPWLAWTWAGRGTTGST